MVGKNALLHLRIPFSFFLLPIFAFALSQAAPIRLWQTVVIFFVLHLFVYPASNAYNSYQDQDEGPIGLLKKPPKAGKDVFFVSILFDGIGLAISVLLGWVVFLQVLAYSLVSRAYSWHGIRLKKYPVASFLVVSAFQGGFTYLLFLQVIGGYSFAEAYGYPHKWAGLATTFLTGAIYPLTQIYQHREDGQRGDRTLSLLLGVRGTFVFSGFVFGAALTVLAFYFISAGNLPWLYVLLLALGPVAAYFVWWAWWVWNRPGRVRYEEAMRINILAASLLTLAFVGLRLYQAFS